MGQTNNIFRKSRGNETYKNYLKSDHWQKIRIEALNFYGNVCTRCGESDIKRLNVHHKHYFTLGKENIKNDLIVFCKNCHECYHSLVTKTKNSTSVAFSKGSIKLKNIEKDNRKNWLKRSKKSKIRYILSKNNTV